MGVQTSTFSSFIAGDTIGMRYDIYKLQHLHDFEYFKVYDILDFNDKKALEPLPIHDQNERDLFKLIKEKEHPNIMKVDYFFEDGHFFIVRTYDDDYYGFSWRLQIQRFLESYKKNIEIEEEQIVYWIKQLLTAVEFLHQNNIIHRFIFPDIIVSSPEDTIKMEKSWFKCPEVEFYQAINMKYDIWSVGWTLYNLSALDDARFVLDEVESFENWVRPDIPRKYTRELDRIFKIMTQFDPNLRPSATELLKDPIFKQFENK